MATTTALPMDGDETILDPAAEAEWQILRRQIELAAGFWLGFIFSPSPRPVAVLRRRVEQIYRLHASQVRLVRPSAPEELREILPRLLEPESVGAGCIWVEAVHLDASTFMDLKFRDSLTEMDSRFRGNDGQTATASVKVTCLAEMTSFPRKRESIA